MLRIRAILLGLLAMLAVSAVSSATASAAEPQGPWYRHLVGGQQVKLPQFKEWQVKSVNQSPFILKGEVGGTRINIECKSVESHGWIWNGAHQGQDQVKTGFGQCALTTPVTCPVTVGETKTYSELMWKYKGVAEELKEPAGGQQKIYNVFAPEEEAVEKAGEFRSVYTRITLPKECGALVGTFAVEAAGTHAEFVDQHQVPHKVVWGTAAFVAPQNYDLEVGELVWNDPNVTWLHHQGGAVTARLLFSGAPAELQGQLGVRGQEGERLGAFNE